jgi:hypothetical protein
LFVDLPSQMDRGASMRELIIKAARCSLFLNPKIGGQGQRLRRAPAG